MSLSAEQKHWRCGISWIVKAYRKRHYRRQLEASENSFPAINSNTVPQISASFEVGVPDSFLIVSCIRGIDAVVFTWFASTRLYTIPRPRESVLSAVREGRILGIFNIKMPLLYEGGRENTFKWLQEEINKRSKGKHIIPVDI